MARLLAQHWTVHSGSQPYKWPRTQSPGCRYHRRRSRRHTHRHTLLHPFKEQLAEGSPMGQLHFSLHLSPSNRCALSCLNPSSRDIKAKQRLVGGWIFKREQTVPVVTLLLFLIVIFSSAFLHDFSVTSSLSTCVERCKSLSEGGQFYILCVTRRL